MSFFFSFHAIYSAEMGVTTDILGVAVMIGSVSQFPFMLLFPKIFKKFPVVAIFCISGLATAFRWFMYAYALNSVTIYFIWALQGAGFIVFYLCLANVVSNTVAPGLRASGQAMNALVLFGVSRIVGSMLGGFSADIWGMSATFAISGALCVAATAAFFLVARKMDWSAPTPAENQTQ